MSTHLLHIAHEKADVLLAVLHASHQNRHQPVKSNKNPTVYNKNIYFLNYYRKYGMMWVC